MRFRAKGRAVKPNITVYTLPPLLLPPDERYGPLFRLGQLRLARFIAGRMEAHRSSAQTAVGRDRWRSSVRIQSSHRP